MPHTYKWDETSINEKIELWLSFKEIMDITELYTKQLTPFEKAEYPEAAIYEDFDAFDLDAETMRSFHEANPTEKLELVNCFSDPRFRKFAKRIIYDNHYEILGEEERSKFSNAIFVWGKCNLGGFYLNCKVGRNWTSLLGFLNPHR